MDVRTGGELPQSNNLIIQVHVLVCQRMLIFVAFVPTYYTFGGCVMV